MAYNWGTIEVHNILRNHKYKFVIVSARVKISSLTNLSYQTQPEIGFAVN